MDFSWCTAIHTLMLRHTANAIPFATLIASPSSQHSCKSTHKAFTIVSIKVHQENTGWARIQCSLLSACVPFASGGDACETACGYFYNICLMQLSSLLEPPAVTESSATGGKLVFSLLSPKLQKEFLMNASSELMAEEFEFALQRWLHFILNNAKKGFIESSWLGFIAVLYAY